MAAPYSCVTDAGLSHLGNCASLRRVDVSFCTLITDRGLVALAAGLRTKLQMLQTFRVSMSDLPHLVPDILMRYVSIHLSEVLLSLLSSDI